MLDNIKAELQAFGKYVVQQSRTNLTKQKHNVSKNLYNSIRYDLEEKKDSFRTIGFILQRSIFAQGIKPTMFFTKPFEVAFERYKKGIKKSFMQDIIDLIKNNNGKN